MATPGGTGLPRSEIEARERIFAEVVARFHRDAAYRARVLADPAGTLRAAGLPIPADKTVKLLQNTDTLVHVVLPPTR